MRTILLNITFLFLVLGCAHAATIEVSSPGQNIGFGSTNPGATVDVLGTVRANYFSGNVSLLSGTGSFNTSGSAATVSTGAQPAITSVGTLTGLIVNTSNVGIYSLAPGSQLDVGGSVRAVAFFGNGSGLTGISGSVSGLATNNVPKASNSTTLVSGSMTDVGGNIGVGSTNPGQAMDINGSLRAGFLYGNGSNLTGIGGAISGLTTGTFVKAASSTTITNSSVMTELSGNIGIGSANPGQILDTPGTIRAYQFVTGNGAAVITGDVNGNVGIGSATPGQTLDVNGDVRATSFFGSGANLTGLVAGAWTHSGSTTTLVNSSDNVGVGSATPGSSFDVLVNQANGNPQLRVINTNSGGFGTIGVQNDVGDVGGIQESGSGNGTAHSLIFFNSKKLKFLSDNNTVNGGTDSITFQAGGYNNGGTASTVAMTIGDSNGGQNVGIGTTRTNSISGLLQIGNNASAVGQASCWGTNNCAGYCTAGTYPACSSCTCLQN